MTRRLAGPPSGLHAPVAESGSKRVITTGSRSRQERSSTGVVDGGKIVVRPMQQSTESSPKQERHEEYMRRRKREEKRRLKAQRVYEKAKRSSSKECGDERRRQADAQSDALEQAGKEAYGYVDMVNSPSHYNQSGIECIDALEAMTGDGFEYHLQATAVKYLWRYRYKGKPLEDLKKARWYLDKLIGQYED